MSGRAGSCGVAAGRAASGQATADRAVSGRAASGAPGTGSSSGSGARRDPRYSRCTGTSPGNEPAECDEPPKGKDAECDGAARGEEPEAAEGEGIGAGGAGGSGGAGGTDRAGETSGAGEAAGAADAGEAAGSAARCAPPFAAGRDPYVRCGGGAATGAAGSTVTVSPPDSDPGCSNLLRSLIPCYPHPFTTAPWPSAA
ncbi:hypothetical protein Val02_41080 [Virgisporangium aliadipatigenens]|uniref:Uncharacterized protein n=1 Tax=Virgisporangium aliadipatigenens TaxID=741659 RepID=A0A8J3YMQ5_9ACTN|nr:hypothetical protein Val02_41080 [Virgisporangium aliadipatigenens]